MTREETKKILMIVSASYPNWHPQDMSFTVDVWAMMLEDYTYNQIALALKAYITTNESGFAPSVGQVLGKLQEITTPKELNEMEAWGLVSRALRNGYYGAEEEYEKLPPLVQKAIGSPSQLRNWSQTSVESVENVVQSNFMRAYRNVLAWEKDIQKMPTEAKKIIMENIQKRLEVNNG